MSILGLHLNKLCILSRTCSRSHYPPDHPNLLFLLLVPEVRLVPAIVLKSASVMVVSRLFSLVPFQIESRYGILNQSTMTGISIHGLLSKRELKMAGYWPSSFFGCLWTETKARSINTQKTERGQHPAILTEQAWSKKDLLYGIKHQKNDLWSCGTKREIPSGQYSSILPAQVANQSAGFGSFCPLTELVI